MVKNLLAFTGLIGILAWLWFPNFSPEDIITFGIIAQIGIQMYLLISVILIIIAYNIIDGKTIKDKLISVKKGIKKVI